MNILSLYTGQNDTLPEGRADFLLAGAVTRTCEVEGITQAGIPGKIHLTPTLDAEFLGTGKVFSLENLAETATGIPTPGLLTRAVHTLAPFAGVKILDLGLVVKPKECDVETFSITASPSIAENVLFDAKAVFETGRQFGRTYKPEGDYDLGTFAEDAARVVRALGWRAPILVGQSWGATVVLEVAARTPELVRGVGCVDGGFLDLRDFPGATWESIAHSLRPPNLTGTPRRRLAAMIRAASPEWDATGVRATLANFEALADGTVRPWLCLDHHMEILRGLWELDTATLFDRVSAPVLLCVADRGRLPSEVRRRQVAAAEAGLRRCAVRRFADTDHDIHVHRPRMLAEAFLAELESGIWSARL